VKLRGYRIEPGEIAAQMREHPAVQDAVVVLREERLVAYVVEEASNQATRNPGQEDESAQGRAAELRAFLKERLPEYMVPSYIVTLDALPLTANGKLDRRALPEPDGQRPTANEYVEPQTAIERAVAQVWQQVLGVDQVGRYDNFFDLGGHSLLMVQIHSKLRDVLNTNISMVDLFTYPTVSAIAQHLSQTQAESSPFQASAEDAHSRSDARRQRRQLRQSRRSADSQESDTYE
jgi:acyl carrier protein